MAVKTDFPYPKENYTDLLKDFYTEINGVDSFDPVKEWQSDTWSANIYCSRGKVLEKAGYSIVHVKDGTIDDRQASITLFETLAYPANPRIPGVIIMTNMNKTEEADPMVVLYTDLIIQGNELRDEDKALFSSTLKNLCQHHGRDFDEYNAFAAGRGLLGGYGGECGMLYFFTQEDIPFLEETIKAVLPAYKQILLNHEDASPTKEDLDRLYKSRARIIEWITVEDYGIKVARENGIPMEVIEAYGFPPVIQY